MWFADRTRDVENDRIGDTSNVTATNGNFPALPTEPGIYKLVKINNKLDIVMESNIIKTKELILGNVSKKVLRVWDRYCNYSESVGSINIGDSGSGKTLECDILANIAVLKGNMPVLKITGFNVRDNEIQFFQSINNCCLYFDEFAKHVGFNEQQKLLPLLTNGNKKFLTLFTENSKQQVSTFITNRTQRVRYLEEFGKLDKQVVLDFISLFEVKESLVEELMARYEKALIFSMDNLEAIISEHLDYPDEPLDELIKYLNLSSIKNSLFYNLRSMTKKVINDKTKEATYEEVEFIPTKLSRESLKEGTWINPIQNESGFVITKDSIKEIFSDTLIIEHKKYRLTFKYE